MTANDTGNSPVTFLSHAQMREHQEADQAEPLSRVITDFVKYDGHWWIADRQGWHLVDDAYLIAKLDNHASWAGGSLYASGS